MKRLYKFFFLTVLSLVMFLTLLKFIFNDTEDKILKPLIEQGIQKSEETILLPNDNKSCLKETPTFNIPNNEPKKQITSNHDDWVLIWQDEFEDNCININNWNIEDFAAEKNNELQYYTSNNVKVEDGVLKLISKNERYKGKKYTSGAVHTKGKFDLLYGKAEMRAKLPTGQGIFPAFWLITDKENTWLPEIDIMEMLGHQPNEIWMVSHWLGENGKLKSDFSSYTGEDFSKEFHTFSIEWAPDTISWFIDGIERFKSTMYIPNVNMYLYLNTAVGGNWPGSPDHTTGFPAIYEIDYVKVFKRNKVN
ncbi:glycoside hydrolase family 16 protein [Solibacillus sp. FSL W7-1472]|uniref:glycoside hydrolase family 16 protein n=1 Tax=Solibacillus sp. FSL W7-1472 TaxID=2921707 RepID=UPI0030D71CA8